LHLANKVQGRLALFTTLPDTSAQYLMPVYDALIAERDTYIRSVGIDVIRHSHNLVRKFSKGDFLETFLPFVESYRYDLLVLPSATLPPRILHKLVTARKRIISLSPAAPSDGTDITSTNENFFVETLHRSVCYNCPRSFHQSLSANRDWLNRIARIFTR
jgi:hypothetical protein